MLMQVLRAGKATQAALGYHVHHGSGGLVHYSTAPAAAAAAAAAAPGDSSSSRSFCLSREKVTMQQLNRRLASYLQQVQCLEAANQKLESQIQRELDKKCPGELRQLDRHLGTVSLLQDQMSDCLSAQAQVRLQLLSAELNVFDLNLRCEKERERRGCMEAELSDLKLLEEELHVRRLPELQSLLTEQTQELTELQTEHQQDMQDLLAHMSGGVTVEMQSAKSSDLIQQLDDLRQTSVMLLDKNQNESWLNAQVSMLNSPEVTFDPPAGSEVIQAELKEVRKRAASLEEELIHLKSTNMVLEASGQEQNESFVQQLVVLQQRADSLCNDLDSVLQAAAQQAADYQNLLDVKTRLETEIQDYMRLLDGLSPQGVSSLHPNSAANITSLWVPTSPCTFRRNITVNKTAGLQGGNFRMMEVQDVSRGHIRTVGKTPVVAPVSETVTTVQSVRVQQSEHTNRSPVTSVNTSNVTGSFHKSEKQRTRAPLEKGSMTFSSTINRQDSPVEDEFHAEDRDLKKSSIVSTQISQGLDRGVVAKASKLETNTAKGTTTLISAAVETKPEMFTQKSTTEVNKTETKIQTVITKTIPCVEPGVKQGLNFGTHTTTTDQNKCIVTEVKKETETASSAQLNCTGGPIQGKHQDPPQVESLNLETQAEAVKDVATAASVVTGSLILTSEEAQGKVSGDLTLIGDKVIERQEKTRKEEVDGILTVVRLDQRLSDASKDEQKKVLEDADTGSAIASSGSPDNIITSDPHRQPADVQAKPLTSTSNQTTTEGSVQANKTEVCIQTVVTKTIPCAEPEVKQGPVVTVIDTNKQTAAEVKRETETEISAQINCTEGHIQAQNKDPTQVVSSSLETQAKAVQGAGNVSIAAPVVTGSLILTSEEAQGKVSADLTLIGDKDMERQEKNRKEEVDGILTVVRLDQRLALSDASKDEQKTVIHTVKDPAEVVSSSLETQAEAVQCATNVSIAASVISGSNILRSEEAQDKVSGNLTLMNDKAIERNEEDKGVEGTLTVLRLDRGAELPDASNSKQNKVTEDADTGSSTVTATSSSTDSNENLESKTKLGIITLTPATQSDRSADVQAKPATFTSNQTTAEAVIQASKIETNIQTVITKTIPCVEPEVKQEPNSVTHMTTIDSSKQTAAEVKKETETVISAQINHTEDSIQAENKDPAQVVSSSLETQTVSDAGNFAITASVVSGSNILKAEEAQNKVSDELTLMDDKDIKRQENNGETEVEGTVNALTIDESTDLSDTSNMKQNKVTEDGNAGSVVITSSSSPDSNDNLISKTTQGIITLGPETQSVTNAVVQAKLETFTSNQTTTEAGMQANKTETQIQTVTKTIPCAEAEVKQQPKVDPTNDPNKQTAAEVNRKTETVISAQMNHAEGSIQGKHQDPAQVVSLCPETLAEVVGDAGDDAVKASAQLTIFDLTLMDDKDTERQEKKGEEEVVSLSDASNSKQNKVVEDADTGSGIAAVSSGSLDNNDNLESKIASTESLNQVELVKKVEVVNSLHDTKEEKGGPTELDNEMVILADQEALLSITESKMSTSRNDSSVAVSSSKSEVDPEERVLSTCLSAVEAKLCPNGDEEDEEVCLSLTETNAHVRPVEKYILSTKEEGQSPSFSRDQALPEVDRNRKVSVSVRGGESLRFGSLEGEKGSRGTVNDTDNSKPTSQGISLQVSSSGDEAANAGGTDASSSGNTDAAGVKGSLGQTSVSLPKTGSKESPSGVTIPATSQQKTGRFDNRGSGEGMVYGGSLGRKSSLLRTKSEESPSAAMLLATSPPQTKFGSRGSGVVYSSSPKHTTILAGSHTLPNTESRESLPTAMHRAVSPPGTGKFGSRGSGEFRVYGGSSGRISSWAGSNNLPTADRKENPSVAAQLPISPPGSIGGGKFGSRGSGELRVYGGSSGRISSWAGSHNLPTADRKENPLVAAQLPTSPPGSIGGGKLGSRGSGEFRVYGGSSGRISSWAGSDNLSTADRKENPLVAAQLPTSPPGSIGGGKLGSRGSGEWRVYGGSSGRISSWAGSDNLSTADRKENPSVAAQLPTSPPGSIGAGRFGSAGSGEWRVYGGSSERLSSAGNTDKVSVGKLRNQSSGRHSSGSNSGRLGSGSIVRRSSSLGSGGKLSSSGSGGKLSSSGSGGRVSSPSGSNRTSTSGRFSSTASGENKPVYSSASGRKSTVGSAGRSAGGGTIGTQRAQSPGRRLSASTGNITSGSGSKLSSAGGSDRVSSRTGARISSSSGSGRTNSTGGRVITSSDRPIRSTGSGTGSNERISVCKMAALSISAAGRERSEDRQRQTQRHQQQQQKAAGTSPLLQRWLTSGVEVKTANPDGLDDLIG